MNDPTQAFWDDLNHNLADPEFRAAYEKERLAMSAADLIAEARKRVTTLRSADIESQSEVLLWWLADALEASVTQSHVSDVVTTVAELDALPNGSIVRADYDGTVTAERRWDLWYVTAWGDDNGVTSQYILDWVEQAAFTVLWVGGTE